MLRYSHLGWRRWTVTSNTWRSLLARARGFGKRKLLVCDRGPDNLQIGLDAALAVVGGLEPETLAPRD